jgi:hypothetical protein
MLSEVLISFHNRLTGEDGDGLGIDTKVYTEGAVDASQSPYVSIQVPRQPNGEKFIGGDGKRLQVRQPIRVHTRHKPQKANRAKALNIASNINTSIEGAPISISGKNIHIPVPDKRPIPPYEVSGKQAYDMSLRYDLII